jgi:hypothetical protein
MVWNKAEKMDNYMVAMMVEKMADMKAERSVVTKDI